MSENALSNIGACVFDAYGTLFDVHSALQRGGAELGDKAQPVSGVWRLKQLEYAWMSDIMGSHVEFWDATSRGLEFALAAHGVEDARLHRNLLDLYLSLDAYPDAVPCLEALRAHGVKTAILSNGSPKMLDAAVSSAGLAALLDDVLSVEDVGVYKPAPPAYQLAVDRLGMAAENICFISTNGWDVAGAAVFGFRVCWNNRFTQPPERLPGDPAAVMSSLAELPGLLGA